jgi:hypothetical protein
MTHNSHSPARDSAETLYSNRVGKTHCQGHQNPSKSVPIFLRGTEANLKMVPIWPVPIPRNRTVLGMSILNPTCCLFTNRTIKPHTQLRSPDGGSTLQSPCTSCELLRYIARQARRAPCATNCGCCCSCCGTNRRGAWLDPMPCDCVKRLKLAW